ncbi:trehalose-6-phosphate synthase [Sphingomonas parva]|uniref:Trehalose-6-phosphate synthase n=1 Tax=Sphingomonas parva TaxID=2555898 RepID=A0A4Y8ZM42_9SPHN|nr:trehalose-6-phosphate synthase [Sphingomonas parva]TFI57068.1 trehalose-6-phosphate synthase [Sphingomonas parva]
MSRMIVVSNRVQVSGSDAGGAQGGLAVALSAALREHQGLWFGWSGERTDTFSGHIDFRREQGVTTATIDLEDQDIEEYYDGYANRTLWPLFHYRIDLAEYERDFAGGYARVNARFADTLRPLLETDDVVWVQDYHLLLVGAELRRRGCRNRIGFFLHIPWPPKRLLSTLPGADALVRAMFAYDVIGFHTREWLESFREYAVLELGAVPVGNGGLAIGDTTVELLVAPIGIETADFKAAVEGSIARAAFRQMQESANGRAMIIGVDRLDYSKGLEERFAGYERFLRDCPDQRKSVFLLQIAPPSRATVESYRRIRATLDGLSGRINGAYADVDWVPLRYVNRGYPREVLAGFYRAARIGLVTPLRDGMNLVAKEYVAAQDPDDPGVLILSRFAGAAAQLSDAVLVNPYSAEELSDAIGRALSMRRAERIRRWRALMAVVEREDVIWWRRRCTEALLGTQAAAEEIREPA